MLSFQPSPNSIKLKHEIIKYPRKQIARKKRSLNSEMKRQCHIGLTLTTRSNLLNVQSWSWHDHDELTRFSRPSFPFFQLDFHWVQLWKSLGLNYKATKNWTKLGTKWKKKPLTSLPLLSPVLRLNCFRMGWSLGPN